MHYCQIPEAQAEPCDHKVGTLLILAGFSFDTTCSFIHYWSVCGVACNNNNGHLSVMKYGAMSL